METIKIITQCVKTREQVNIAASCDMVEHGCHIGLPEETDQNVITKLLPGTERFDWHG
ncbi:MAG: hypothetical protein ABI834_11865 [Ginsengibacter sp.]